MNHDWQPATVLARGAVADPGVRHRLPEVDRAPVGSRRPNWRVPAVIAAVLGLGAVALVAANSDESFKPVAEPAVAAQDLPLGSMYHVVDQIGARALWAQGITGSGVNVAVIDTGVAPVDGLADDGKVVAVADLSAEGSDPTTAFIDTHGHGTHMAGIIAGRETGADPSLAADHPEWFLGVAPDAGIVSVKVADRAGDAQLASVISGVDWVIENADALDIGVLNLSYSSGSELPYQNDPLTAALERAWQAGIVVVVPAGNSGPDSPSLDAPANDPFVLAVAAADVSADGVAIADFASSGDGVRQPDVSAPGAHIDSLRVPGSDADVNHPEGFVDDETFRGSGSSQSAAVASGAAALLLDARPDLTPDQVKALLTASADEISSTSPDRAGSGLIDLERAITTEVSAATQTWAPASFDGPIPTVSGPAAVWAAGSTWAGSTWAGSTWAGSTWAGSTWAGSTWAGSTWAGSTWAGFDLGGFDLGGFDLGGFDLGSFDVGWFDVGWFDVGWFDLGWSTWASTWAGSTWAGSTWAGSTWAGSTWAGSTWAGSTWAGSTWA